MKTYINRIFIVAIAVTFMSCNDNNKSAPDRDTTHVGEYMTTDSIPVTEREDDNDQDREEFKNSVKRELDTIDMKIERLEEKIKVEKGETRKRSMEKRDNLKVKSQKLRKKLNDSRPTNEEWNDFKSEVKNDMNDLGNRIENFFDDDDKDVEVEVKTEKKVDKK